MARKYGVKFERGPAIVLAPHRRTPASHDEFRAWVSSIKGLVVGAFILAHLICVMRPERTTKQELWGLVFFVVELVEEEASGTIGHGLKSSRIHST